MSGLNSLADLIKKKEQEKKMNRLNGKHHERHANEILRDELRALEEQEPIEYEWPETYTPSQRKLIGAGIKAAREQAGLTQARLEQLCGFKHGQISQFENGNVVTMDKPRLKKMAYYCKNDFNELIRDSTRDNIAVAMPGSSLIYDEEKTFKVRGNDFELRCTMDSTTFSLAVLKNGMETQIYSGKRTKNHQFIEGIKEIMKRIEKGI